MEFLVGNQKKFIEFISELDADDKIAILSHTDGDGIFSALIMSRVLGKVDFVDFIQYKHNMLEEYVEKLKKRKINKVLISDLAVGGDFENIKKIEKFADILVIDHHELIMDLNSERTTMLKTNTKYPASYICYKLFSKIQHVPCWMGVIGTLSDSTHKYRKENAEEIFDDFDFRGCERKNYFKETVILGNTLVYFKDNVLRIFNLLKDMKEFNNLKNLEKFSDKVEKQINYFVNDFESNKEVHEDIIFYQFKPDYSINSIVSTILSLKHKDSTLIIIKENKNQDDKTSLASVSCRSQNANRNCPEVLKAGIKGIPNSTAGGHAKAAGANFPLKYIDTFKTNILNILKSE
ncbi:hypothetical protein GF378_02730 [Candidatus Pacearchaeota archaeon]|nr:hypothetical protein [Candidatus Pacearchaeota archaeon]